MSGSGTMTPTTGESYTVISGKTAGPLCVTFDESLRILDLPLCSSYGAKTSCPNHCRHTWGKKRREWWTGKLRAAQTRIQRRLGAPLCPRQIRQEVHPLQEEIQLRQAPISYLGVMTQAELGVYTVDYGTIEECADSVPVTDCEDTDKVGRVLIDNAELPAGVTAADLVFVYPENAVYSYNQVLQVPYLTTGLCSGVDGVIATWPKCQLVHPMVDEGNLADNPAEVNTFLSDVRVLYQQVDATQAIELPAGCSACESSSGTVTAEISDAIKGTICITSDCEWTKERIYVNYGTAFGPADRTDVDDDLRSAVVLLALVLSGEKALCSCDDFNATVEYWLSQDPATRAPLATPNMMPYGATRAGMEAARIMNEVLERRHFNQPSGTSGVMTGASLRSIRGSGKRRVS